ncbi:hypothetical protein [Streptomyces atratus]|uniref:DUF6197 family protein n=1 Tax=Streptomyces atratus TaxID=1893 RepID=UPI0021A25D00|nr:hypothetical protein [Streptomyces atratus]MCT2547384.1 hypothetical protein [Streptomyces atratus]
MPQTRTAPTPDHTTTTAAPAPAELSLEERLAFINAAMSVRLDEAKVAYEVNTAHIDTEPVDLDDIVTGPLDTEPALTDLYPTPVAALLQRAHHRLLTGGWCKDVLVDTDGARCMLGAIRIEARGDRGMEAAAAAVLLDAIRRKFGDDVDSVPGFNDTRGTGRIPLRMLGQAAGLADTRGL